MAFNGTITNEPLNFGGLGMTGGRRFRLSTVNFAATGYLALGEPVVIADFNFPVKIEALVLVGITDGATVAINCIFDAENAKLILLDLLGVPIVDAVDVSGVSCKLLAIGY